MNFYMDWAFPTDPFRRARMEVPMNQPESISIYMPAFEFLEQPIY